MAIPYCVSLAFLALLAAEDIRKRELSLYKILLFAFLSLLYQVLSGQFFWREAAGGLIPGGILIVLAFLTGESIGYGDGAAVMALGLWTGGWFTLTVVLIGIMSVGVYGAFRLLKGNRKPIPFLPFLLLGMEVVLYYA